MQGAAEAAQILATDNERQPSNLCFTHQDGCAGDIRFYDWPEQPGNVSKPVL